MSSAFLNESTSMEQMLASLPMTVQMTGMDTLLQFRGISLDMILEAAEQLFEDLVGTDQNVLGIQNGNELSVYESRWEPSASRIASGYTPAMEGDDQISRVVTGIDDAPIRLLQWTIGGQTQWGVEEVAAPGIYELRTFEITGYDKVKTYEV